jgi:hypothetical protein
VHWHIPKESFPRRLFAWPAEKDGEAWMGDSRSSAFRVPPSQLGA